ncbi:MAG: hypothetical protein JXQ90_05765 [Cyclobacteriaceae bacterium]
MALGSNMKKSDDDKKPKGLLQELKAKTAGKSKTQATKKSVKKSGKPKGQTKKAEPKKVVAKAAKPVKVTGKSPEKLDKAQVDQPMATQPAKVQEKFKDAAISLKPSPRKKVRKTKVFLEGKLTINNVSQFHNAITPVFENYDLVDFYLKDVVELDLSFIQMLFYFKTNFAKANKKTVTIDSELPSNIKKIIVKAGFVDLMFIPKLV